MINNSTLPTVVKLRSILNRLGTKKNLTAEEAQFVANKVFEDLKNNSSESLFNMIALFGGLTTKGVTVEELTGIASAIEATKNHMFCFDVKEPLVTAGGTGGDTIPTINVTTPAIIVAAAAGAYALKSGAGAFSSKTGSSDLAQELGINIKSPPGIVKDCVEQIRVTAWASECIYPWMNPLIELGSKKQTKTVMPLLYSLRLSIASGLNPFSLKRQVRGVSKPVTQTIAQVLSNCDYEKALVVVGYGKDENTRIDEVSNLGKTVISEVKSNKKVETYQIYPEDLSVTRGNINEIISQDSHIKNAKVAANILSGKDKSSRLDLVLMNASAILYTADKVKTLKDGYELAMQAVNEGKAIEKLWSLIILSKGQPHKLKAIMDFHDNQI